MKERNDGLIEEVNKRAWLHTIDLGGGVVTPGKWPRSAIIDRAFAQVDFAGKKVLDVGACDGLWSFEAERRGAAAVYSVDYIQHVDYAYRSTYQLAHEALHSRAQYRPDLSVYDIDRLGEKDFDVIIFCGVYYHLKHPLLALAKLRRMLKTNGTMIIEGSVIDDPSNVYARFFYRGLHADHLSNWWVPTTACLREWVECSYFDIVDEIQSESPAYMNGLLYRLKQAAKRALGHDASYNKRCVIVARGVKRKDPRYSFPDEELREFDADG